jgi:hypothetical protein
MAKYQINADVSEGNLEEVRKQISHALNEHGLADRVEVYYGSFSSAPYGVNPIADCDSRSFMELIAPDGEVLFPPKKSDIHPRTSMRDLPSWIGFAVSEIKKSA